MSDKIVFNDDVGAAVASKPATGESVKAPRLHYDVEARNPQGELLWKESFDNLVCDGGINDLLDKYFKGSAYTATWYVGLKGTGAAAAGDTAASHAGWAEVTSYSETVRQTLTLGAVSAKSVNNSAAKATFTINTNNVTIAGAFVISNNTKGGTSGVLYSAGDFSASRTLNTNDTIAVQVTLSGA